MYWKHCDLIFEFFLFSLKDFYFYVRIFSVFSVR